MKKPLHVLLAEDSIDDADIILSQLRRAGFDPIHQRVDTARDMEAALQAQPWDLIISDYSMPGFNGLEALKLLRERDSDLPFILVSGTMGEETAVAAMKAGAHDYLMKDNLTRLGPAIERELAEAIIRRERKKAEVELKAWQEELERRVRERTAELTRAHELLEAAAEERTRLEAEIAHAIEREQLRLSQELHDGLGQQLTGISYMLTALHEKLRRTSPARAREVEKLQRLIDQSIDQTRNLAQGFYPVNLERLGVLVALGEICATTSAPFNVSCIIESDGNPIYDSLKGPVAIQVLRIAQEGLHNALKHSTAKAIALRLAIANDQLVLTIKDDGLGLPADIGQTKGLGFRIMQHRAESIGAKLTIGNHPSGGVIISCSVPLQAFHLKEKQSRLSESTT
jgi:signal transduction histidine kinase